MLAEGGGSSNGVVNYHVRLEDWAPETCEVAGLGVVRSGRRNRLESIQPCGC